jgi:uncharacterized protein (TIGR02145 family)
MQIRMVFFRGGIALVFLLIWHGVLGQPGRHWNPDADADGEVGTLDLLELLGVFGAAWTVPGAVDGMREERQCEPAVDYQGHRYAVVGLGGQCWFAENLRSERYANGEFLLSGLSSGEWLSAQAGAVSVYGSGDSRVYAGSEDEESNYAAFGRLYNGLAASDERGLCPMGWRIPTLEDWEGLLEELGGACVAGRLLQSAWNQESADAAPASGFNALMGGGRNYGGFYGNADETGFFWSDAREGRSAAFLRVDRGISAASMAWSLRGMGASVRCVSD